MVLWLPTMFPCRSQVPSGGRVVSVEVRLCVAVSLVGSVGTLRTQSSMPAAETVAYLPVVPHGVLGHSASEPVAQPRPTFAPPAATPSEALKSDCVVTQQFDSEGDGLTDEVDVRRYNRAGQITSSELDADADGHVDAWSEYEYDGFLRLVTMTVRVAQGHSGIVPTTTTYRYDGVRLVSVQETIGQELDSVREFEYRDDTAKVVETLFERGAVECTTVWSYSGDLILGRQDTDAFGSRRYESYTWSDDRLAAVALDSDADGSVDEFWSYFYTPQGALRTILHTGARGEDIDVTTVDYDVRGALRRWDRVERGIWMYGKKFLYDAEHRLVEWRLQHRVYPDQVMRLSYVCAGTRRAEDQPPGP